jgi:hypothetical protein
MSVVLPITGALRNTQRPPINETKQQIKMQNSHRIKSIIEAITHELGITVAELVEGGENSCEIGIARRVTYLMKQFCLPQITDEEFFHESFVHLLNQHRDEATPMEQLLFEHVRIHYYKILSSGEREPELSQLISDYKQKNKDKLPLAFSYKFFGKKRGIKKTEPMKYGVR